MMFIIVVWSICTTFAAILLTEASLRLIGFYRPPVEIPDPIAGNFRSPNFQFRYTDEGDAQVAINSYGQRDREHTVAKPRNTYRIAVLGDSFAEAYQVNRSEA